MRHPSPLSSLLTVISKAKDMPSPTVHGGWSALLHYDHCSWEEMKAFSASMSFPSNSFSAVKKSPSSSSSSSSSSSLSSFPSSALPLSISPVLPFSVSFNISEEDSTSKRGSLLVLPMSSWSNSCFEKLSIPVSSPSGHEDVPLDALRLPSTIRTLLCPSPNPSTLLSNVLFLEPHSGDECGPDDDEGEDGLFTGTVDTPPQFIVDAPAVSVTLMDVSLTISATFMLRCCVFSRDPKNSVGYSITVRPDRAA